MTDQITQWPNIILLNGSSSAGKSTLAKALQQAFTHPYLHLGFDDLIMTAPEHYWKDAATPLQTQNDDLVQQGVEMRNIAKPGEPKHVIAEFGPVFQRIIRAMAPTVATLVQHGNAVIFDHVIHDQAMYDDCKHSFKPFNVLTIGVFCPLDILEQREQQRGDRVIGRARGLFDVVHNFCDYDLSIDTSKTSVSEAVNQIKQQLQQTKY